MYNTVDQQSHISVINRGDRTLIFCGHLIFIRQDVDTDASLCLAELIKLNKVGVNHWLQHFSNITYDMKQCAWDKGLFQ